MPGIDEIRKLHAPVADSALTELMTQVLGAKDDTALTAYTATDSMMRYIKGLLGLASVTSTGKTQIIRVPVASAANIGDVLLATVTSQEILIKKVNVRSNGATTANLTNIGIYAGAGKVVTLIDNVTGARANIAAADQQVGNSPLGGVVLAVAKTIVITLTGTGAAAVDLTVTIEYESCVAGGYLV